MTDILANVFFDRSLIKVCKTDVNRKKTLSFLAILLCLCQSVPFRKVRRPLKTHETHPGKVFVGMQKKKIVVITYEGEKPTSLLVCVVPYRNKCVQMNFGDLDLRQRSNGQLVFVHSGLHLGCKHQLTDTLNYRLHQLGFLPLVIAGEPKGQTTITGTAETN